MRCLWLMSLGLLSGCISPGESDFGSTWSIKPPEQASSVYTKVFLPADLRRPSLVTYDRGQMTVHDLERWAAPLQESLARNLAGRVAHLPIQNLVVNVQRLEVSTSGAVTLLFTANFTHTQNPGSTLEVKSGVIQLPSVNVVSETNYPLTAAFGGYVKVPDSIGQVIEEWLRKEQGVIAKPATTVTVPSK